MSVRRATVRWAVKNVPQVRCLHQAPVAGSQLCSSIRSATRKRQEQDVLVILRFLQRRHQSSSPQKGAAGQKPPPPSSKELLRALVRQGLDFRPLMNAFTGPGLRKLFHQSPEELVLAIIILILAAASIVWVIYIYFSYYQSEQFTRFPPEIAKSLRRALYYTNIGPDANLAHKYYKRALDQCKEAGLDPFSDEYIGLRIQAAHWLEGIGNYQNAIEVLDFLLQDCKGWVALVDKSIQDGFIEDSGRITPEGRIKLHVSEEWAEAQTEGIWTKRNRVLSKAVKISVKIGQLYADEHVLQGDAAGEYLIWGVETLLKELHRRQVEGLKEAEGDWFKPEEIGAALEALGNHYESRSQHYLAAPLYLHAVTVSPPDSCHTAVLMNNLAVSLAQQPVQPPGSAQAPGDEKSNQPTGQTPTRATLLASARSWALKALATAQEVTGEGRTGECDEACAVAMCNLADVAAMCGDMDEAKRRFTEGLELSQKLAFAPGIAQAKDGLKRVSAPPPPEA
ncbi:putative TPR domain-containing protein [Rosellinia necatrix]|uniref:Putative TPR domain-containing protein n=1 Tax=Rosellinia necatrix TaxID=77044 RepID=A0A1W2TMJ5_ROSNE|nr:putative TPR domain-containing protein [Rosellinia necatrix]